MSLTGKLHPEPRIGLLAKRDLTRLVEEDPSFALRLLKRIDVTIRTGGCVIDQHVRAEPENTRYLYSNESGIISLIILPPGPFRIDEDGLSIAKDEMPEASLAKIKRDAVGSKLSKYISLANFDIDKHYPRGITHVNDNYHGDRLVLSFRRVLLPYEKLANTLRMRAEILVQRELGQAIRDGIKSAGKEKAA